MPAAGEHQFSRLNVVLAGNGSGKSTLCDVFRSLSTGVGAYIQGRTRLDGGGLPEVFVACQVGGQPQVARFQNGNWAATPRPIIHVFDERFVADNVLVGHHISVEQRRNLYGLVIGDAAIALQQAVADAELALNRATEIERAARMRLEQHLPAGQTIESFRIVAAVENAGTELANARAALDAATQAAGRVLAIRRRPPLVPIPFSELPGELPATMSSTLDDATAAAEQAIRRHLAEHSNGLGIEWISEGHRAARNQSCPHCGRDMGGLEILRAYNAFFSGELQRQARARDELGAAINRLWGDVARSRIREIFTAHETEREWWRAGAGYEFELPHGPSCDEVLAAHQAVHTALVDALARKNASPSVAVQLSDAEHQALNAWLAIAGRVAAYNEGIALIDAELNRRKEVVQNLDLRPVRENVLRLDLANKRHQQPVIDAYTAFDAAVREKAEAQRNKQRSNDSLRNETNAMFAQYGDRINTLLRLFAVDFRLVAGGGTNESFVSFAGGAPSGQLAVEILGQKVSSSPDDAADPARASLANTLSGGDRSALALAFFIAKVEREPRLAEAVIAFDDPFHSQDRSRQQRTIEQIRGIAERARQCFVFSHDIDFARALAAGHGPQARTYCLDALDTHTTLQSKELPMPPSRAYETKYKTLTEFLEQPERFAGHLNSVAGALRTVLEEYLQLKFPCRWEHGVDWLGTMIGKIRTAPAGDPLVSCAHLVTDLSQVNDYSQRFHHRSTGATADVPEARELRTYVEQTLRIIHR